MKKLLLALPLLLTSCAEYVPIAGDLVGMADESVVYIKDASIAKEALIHQTLQNRDQLYKESYALSGTTIAFKMLEVMPGVFVQVIDKVESKSPPEFKGELPLQPSIHPVWATVNKVVEVAGKVGMFWIGVDGAKALWESSAPRYEGPYNSYNQTAEPFIVEPVIITP